MSAAYYRLVHGKFNSPFKGCRYWVNVGIREDVDNNTVSYVNMTARHIDDIVKWADSTKICYVSYTKHTLPPLFLFKTESDLMLFVLRWNRVPVSEEALLE